MKLTNRTASWLLALLAILMSAPWPARAQTTVRKLHLTAIDGLRELPWIELATEGAGDTRFPGLPDAKALHYHHDRRDDRLWFRVTTYSGLQRAFFGVNLAFDVDGDPQNGMPWWNTNTGFRFDRLITVWVSDAGAYHQGAVGLGDPQGIERGDLTGLGPEGLQVVLDEEAQALYLGIDRGRLDGGGPMRVLAAVGSAVVANDDLPEEGSAVIPAPVPAAAGGAP